MSFQLQQFDQDKSAYVRPEQPWVCGKTLNGEPCRIGPDQRGNCRATAECAPVRKGDRWMCTRPQLAGGKCPDGPQPDGTCACQITPCQPVRSQRSRRSVVAAGTVAFITGLILLLGGSRYGTQFFSPGPLSLNHAELETRCDACHSAAELSADRIVAMAMKPPEGHDESGKCLACHKLGEHANTPHSLPRSTLDVLIEEAQARPESGGLMRTNLVQAALKNTNQTNDVACAACHREHQGRMTDLSRMTDVRCQSCHEHPFESLPGGHPEFSDDFPTRRRTRIAFNHKTHIDKHFESKNFTATCTTCHVVDPSGERMLVKGFDTTCGSCHHHRNFLAGTGLPNAAVSVFSLPAVDLETLRARGIWTGDTPWPVDAYIGDEVELTPFMRLLMTADSDMVRDLAHFEDPTDLYDLSDASDEVVAAAGRLIWGVKSLILDLTEAGPDGLPQRLLDVLQVMGSVEQTELDALIGQPADVPLPPHAKWHPNLVKLRNKYLPGLAREVRRYKADPSLLRQTPPEPEPEPEPAAADPGDAEPIELADLEDEDILGLGTEDEDILGLGGDEDEDMLGADDEEDLLGGDEDEDMLGGDEDEDMLGGDDDLLGGDEDEDMLGGDDDMLGEGDDDLLGVGDDDLLGGEDDLLGGGDDDAMDEPEDPAPAAEDPQEALDRLREGFRDGGGWIYKDAQYTVAYRPGGHGNQFLYWWLERTSRAGDGPAAAAAAGIFDSLRAEKAPGWCIRCHSVDESLFGRRVNWSAERPHYGLRHFTKFDHAAHFNFDQFLDCTACHSVETIDDETVNEWKASYADDSLDFNTFARSFGPIRKETCAECHTPQGAGDGCLTCHNYHVGDFKLLLRPPEFGAMDEDEETADE